MSPGDSLQKILDLHTDFHPYVNLTLHADLIYGFITYKLYIRIYYIWILHTDLLHMDFTYEFITYGFYIQIYYLRV